MRIVGLAGLAGCGKDTVARFLCETQCFVQIALADPLRDGLKSMFGLTDDVFEQRDLKEQRISWIGRSPRWLMQTIGTEWGREMVNPNVWLNVAARRINAIKAIAEHQHVAGIVVSDIRFENEADWLRAQGGVVWHVRRPGSGLVGFDGHHASEKTIPRHENDRVIDNEATIDELHERVAEIVENEACAC